MPALENILLGLLSFIIFPFTLFNFIVVNTQLIPIKPFVVTSGSMDPAVTTGSIIYAVRQKEYKIGDIIAFSDDKENISHRIVGMTIINGEKYFSTKGDANSQVDEDLITQNNIYGKVTTHIPFIGNAILFLRNMSA